MHSFDIRISEDALSGEQLRAIIALLCLFTSHLYDRFSAVIPLHIWRGMKSKTSACIYIFFAKKKQKKQTILML